MRIKNTRIGRKTIITGLVTSPIFNNKLELNGIDLSKADHYLKDFTLKSICKARGTTDICTNRTYIPGQKWYKFSNKTMGRLQCLQDNLK